MNVSKDITKSRDVTVFDTVATTTSRQVPRKELIKVPVQTLEKSTITHGGHSHGNSSGHGHGHSNSNAGRNYGGYGKSTYGSYGRKW